MVRSYASVCRASGLCPFSRIPAAEEELIINIDGNENVQGRVPSIISERFIQVFNTLSMSYHH